MLFTVVKVSGLSLELTPGIPGVPTKITPKMDQGTEVTMFYRYNHKLLFINKDLRIISCLLSFGDNYLKEEYIADTAALQPFEHTFANGSGTYTVSVRASNKYSFEVASCTVDIDFPVGDVEFAATNVEFGETTTFSQNVTNGTRVRFFWIYGDGMGEERVYDEYSEVTPTTYKYPKPGVYNVTLRVGNVHGYKQLCTVAAVNYKVHGLDFNVSHTKLGDMSIFTQTLINGSHMHCLRIVGDGTVQVAYDDEPDTETTWNHTYSEVGSYTVTLRCYNYISQQSVSKIIFVENPVENINMAANNVSRPEESVNFTFSQSAGKEPTNLVITLLYGNTYLEITMNSTLNTSFPYIHSYKYCNYGYYMMTAKLYNHISRMTFSQLIQVGVTMNTLTVNSVNRHVTFADNAELKMSVDMGSRVNYTVDWGDGTVEVHERNQTDWRAADLTYATHNYSTAGYYTVKVNASNMFGSLYQETVFIVQHPLAHLVLIDNNPEIFDGSNLQITYSIKQTFGENPSNATCKSAYANEVFQSPIDFSLTGNKKNFTYVYGSGVKPGHYELRVECENLVSTFNFSRMIWIQEKIQNLALTVAKDAVKTTTENLDLRVNIDKGSHVNYTVDFGDSDINYTFIDFPAKPEHFYHIYTADGNFTVNVTSYNLVSSSWKTIIVFSEFIIKGFTLYANTPVAYPSELLNITIVADTPLPTNVFCDFKVKTTETFNVWSPDFSSGSSTGGAMTFLHQYEQADAGTTHAIEVTCSNKVTQPGVIETKNIKLEETIAGLNLTANKYMISYGERITFTATVENGTNVKDVITFYGSETSVELNHGGNRFSKTQGSTADKVFL